MANDIDQIELSEDEMAGLDPFNGISEDSKDPTPGQIKVTGSKLIKGKGKNTGSLKILVECQLKVDGFAEAFDGDAPGVNRWVTIRGAGGKAVLGRDSTENKNFLKIFGEHLELEATAKAADLVSAWNGGSFKALPKAGWIPVEVSRWEGGLNVNPCKPATDDEG